MLSQPCSSCNPAGYHPQTPTDLKAIILSQKPRVKGRQWAHEAPATQLGQDGSGQDQWLEQKGSLGTHLCPTEDLACERAMAERNM